MTMHLCSKVTGHETFCLLKSRREDRESCFAEYAREYFKDTDIIFESYNMSFVRCV